MILFLMFITTLQSANANDFNCNSGSLNGRCWEMLNGTTIFDENMTVLQDSYAEDLEIIFDCFRLIPECLRFKHLVLIGPKFYDNETILNTNETVFNQVEVLEIHQSLMEESMWQRLFSLFKNVKTLNLTKNELSEIPEGFLDIYPDLLVLDLGSNILSDLPRGIFNVTNKLQWLSLSRNNITILDTEPFIPLENLTYLDLSYNNMIKINIEGQRLHNIATIILSGNKILSPRGLGYVWLNRWKIHTLEMETMSMIKIPKYLINSLQVLKMHDNRIVHIFCGDLDSAPYLNYLDVSYNRIVEVEDDALGRFENLTYINLSKNNIETVPKSLPMKLKTLLLNYNLITNISSTDFDQLMELEVLGLRGNKFDTINGNTFSALKKLTSLDLSENKLKSLPQLEGLELIRILKLSSILLQTNNPQTDMAFPFQNPENLVDLDMRKSTDLVKIFLSDTATLAACKQLQSLDLGDCNVSLSSNLLDYLPQLKVFILPNTQLNCTDIDWLIEWMVVNVDFGRRLRKEYTDLYCVWPPERDGERIIEIAHDTAKRRKSLTITTTIESTSTESMTTKFEPIEQTSTEIVPTSATISSGIEQNSTTNIPELEYTASTEEYQTQNSFVIEESTQKIKYSKPEYLVQSEKHDNFSLSQNMSLSGEMYLYESLDGGTHFHPGLIISAIGIALVSVVTIVVIIKLARQRIRKTLEVEESIEVNGVLDLW